MIKKVAIGLFLATIAMALVVGVASKSKRVQTITKTMLSHFPIFGAEHGKFFSAGDIDGKLVLSWSLPTDSFFDHIELYVASERSRATSAEGTKIKLDSPKQSYVLLDIDQLPSQSTHLYFTLLFVDQFGRVAAPQTIRIRTNRSEQAQADHLFKYEYFQTVKFPVYSIESDLLKAYFARGVLIGIEKKNSDEYIHDTAWGFMNSYLTAGDIDSTQGLVFALYRDYYNDETSALAVTATENSIRFERYYERTEQTETVSYKFVNSRDLEISFRSDFDDRAYSYRTNLLGDDDFKASSSWQAKGVKSIPADAAADKVKNAAPNVDRSDEQQMSYMHTESFNNDEYPYLASRRFLELGDQSQIDVFHHDKQIFSFFGPGDQNFFYKNCSGEEGFTYGHDLSFANRSQKHIKNKFDITMRTTY